MMKGLAIVVLTYLFAAALAVKTCKSKQGQNLEQFNGRTQDVYFPCKYWALRRQRCGRYTISLSPGNHWIYPKYQLDTLWLGVNITETGEYWEGRTTNKLAVKYFNSEGIRELFNKKDGTPASSDIFTFGRDSGIGVYIKDINNTFKVTFTPWDPDNRNDFPNSDFKFECFDDSAELNEYPSQLCGGNDSRAVKTRASEVFHLPGRFRENVIYFDTLTNPEIVQTDPQCTNATDILVNVCQDATQQLNVINNCKDILYSNRHTRCVTHYNCDPMVVFNACLMWGCTGTGFERAEEGLCKEVAEGIDFCPEFSSSGNLTDRVKAAKCYKNFIAINTDLV